MPSYAELLHILGLKRVSMNMVWIWLIFQVTTTMKINGIITLMVMKELMLWRIGTIFFLSNILRWNVRHTFGFRLKCLLQ